MYKTSLTWASLFGITAVMLGAFGAHALQSMVVEKKIESFRTGVTYQFYHTITLLALGWIQYNHPKKIFRYATFFFIIGTILFSGSLYILTFVELNALGFATPIGGVFFILGWLCLLIGIRKINVLPTNDQQ